MLLLSVPAPGGHPSDSGRIKTGLSGINTILTGPNEGCV
jgi:hypothetical protein